MSEPIVIPTWNALRDEHIARRLLPFRAVDCGTYLRILAFDGPTQVFTSTIDKGSSDEADFNEHYADYANAGSNTIQTGVSVPWHVIKDIADDQNLVPTLGFVKCMGFYLIWLTYKGITFSCNISVGSADATEFESAYKPRIRPAVDCDGKGYVRIYSGDQSWQTVSYTTRGDDLVGQKIGEGAKVEWDAAQTSGGRAFGEVDQDGFQTKVMTMSFLESVRILKGNAFWTGGDLDCTLHTRLYIPVGAIYGVDGQGNPLIAPIDIPVYHHINDQSFLGDCPAGVIVMAESSSDPIPPGLVMEITLRKKATNTTWMGFIRLDLYRMQTTN